MAGEAGDPYLNKKIKHHRLPAKVKLVLNGLENDRRMDGLEGSRNHPAR